MEIKNLVISTATTNCYQIEFKKNFQELYNSILQLNKKIIFCDENVYALNLDFIKNLEKIIPLFLVLSGEKYKNLSSVNSILEFFAANKSQRDTQVIVIGGGMVQDLVMFAAHIYLRGLPVILVPTTLLAMSDSCVGGKCGVNFANYKNQIGAIHSPKKILVCSDFLSTLLIKEIYSGLGEIFKCMLLDCQENFENFYSKLIHLRISNLSDDFILHHVRLALAIKKNFVEKDLMDCDDRRFLNFGHTFGHAIETLSEFSVPHGVAVAYGIDIANYVATKLGILSFDIMQKIHQIIYSIFPFEEQHENILGKRGIINLPGFISIIKKDKKITADKLNLVLMRNFGDFLIYPVDIDTRFEALLANYSYFSIN